MKKLFDQTFLRFVLVGGVNTLLCSGLQFVLFNVFYWSYWPATAANYIVGSVISFFLNKYFTFRFKESSWKLAGLFVAEIICCYLIAYGVAKPLAGAIFSGYSMKTQENLAMLAGMGMFSVLNYLGQRFLVFRKK